MARVCVFCLFCHARAACLRAVYEEAESCSCHLRHSPFGVVVADTIHWSWFGIACYWPRRLFCWFLERAVSSAKRRARTQRRWLVGMCVRASARVRVTVCTSACVSCGTGDIGKHKQARKALPTGSQQYLLGVLAFLHIGCVGGALLQASARY